MTDPGTEKRETSLRDLLAVLFRRKWVVLAVFLATIGAVVLANRLAPEKYESVAQVLVSLNEPGSAFSVRSGVVSTVEDALTSELETIKSSHILQMAQGVLDQSGAHDSHGLPIKVSTAEVTATTVPRTSIIYIQARSADPRAAQEVARAVTKAYSDFRLNVRTVPELDSFFREEMEEVRGQLDDWEKRRADFMNAESVSGLAEERTSAIDIRRSTEVELNSLRATMASDQAMIDVLEKSLQDHARDPNSEIYSFSESNPGDDQIILQIKKELVAKRSALFSARSQFQDSHPEVKALSDQVDQLEALLLREIGSYVKHLKDRMEVSKAREDALQGTMAYSDAELASFPNKEAKLASFDRVIDALTTDYHTLADKQMQTRLDRIGTPDWNVMVLQPPSDAQKVRTTDLVRMALIPLIGLIVAVALAFLIDGFDHSLKDATEAEQHLGIPVLGSVGRLR